MILRQQQFQPVARMISRIIAPVTIRETLYDLIRRGYRVKFRREGSWLYCCELDRWFMPDSFTIDEYYHFEAGPDSYGDKMLYAISSGQGLKGFLTDTCFVHSGSLNAEIIERPEWDYLCSGVF
jgi:hypothetical protein